MSFRFTCDQTMFCVKIFSLKINGKADFVTGLSQTPVPLVGNCGSTLCQKLWNCGKIVVWRFVKWFSFSVFWFRYKYHNLVLDTFLNTTVFMVNSTSYSMLHSDSIFTAWERPINFPIKTILIGLKSDFQFSVSDPLAKWPKATKLPGSSKLFKDVIRHI